MSEYIERGALLNNRPEGRNIGQIGKEEYNKGWNDCCHAFFECIEEEPAADVVEVKHGRWYWEDDDYCRCSECTQKAPVVPQYQDEPITTKTNYCPNCGAKMRGDGE